MSTTISNIPDEVTFEVDENTRIEWNAEDNRATIIQESDGKENRVNVSFDSVHKIQSVLGDCDIFMEYKINH